MIVSWVVSEGDVVAECITSNIKLAKFIDISWLNLKKKTIIPLALWI